MMTNKIDFRSGAANRFRMLPALLVAAVLAGALPVAAAPQIMSQYGDQMPWISAEINAMGGTGVALYRGGLSLALNPACLTDEAGTRVDVGFSVDQEHEDRFQPLFDSFASWVTDAAIASNRQHYWQTGFALAGRWAADSPVVVAAALTDRYPFTYTFDEELRNPSPYPPGLGEPARDLVIAQRERKVTGVLRAFSLGAAAENERASFGAAVHYNFGTRTQVDLSRDTDMVAPDNSFRNRDERDLSGVNMSLGGRVIANERLTIGFAYESPLTADGDWYVVEADAADPIGTSNRYDGSYRYPGVYRVGLAFHPRTEPRTVLSLDVEHKLWSRMAVADVSGDLVQQNLPDITDVRLGLEHTFYNGMPLRFGFRHLDSYADRSAAAVVFSAGTGMVVGQGRLNVSMELAKISSVQPHLFPYPADYFGDNFVTDPAARVEDTRFRMGVAYTMEF